MTLHLATTPDRVRRNRPGMPRLLAIALLLTCAACNRPTAGGWTTVQIYEGGRIMKDPNGCAWDARKTGLFPIKGEDGKQQCVRAQGAESARKDGSSQQNQGLSDAHDQ